MIKALDGKKDVFKTAIKIVEATVGIETNRKELLPPSSFDIEVKSLLTDFHSVDRIPFSDDLDGYIQILDSRTPPHYERHGEKFIFSGPFEELDRTASDPRFSFWGNQGFLYRFVLYLLEKHHTIYSFHACALFNPKDHSLYLVIGGAGSGKTVYLLSGLTRGLRLFSTETVHFRIKANHIEWFKGSVVDNVRFGTLIQDFPQFLPDQKIPAQDNLWQEKIALDLSSFAVDFLSLIDPGDVHILLPHIEEGRQGFIQNTVGDLDKSSKFLFDNISQKIVETTILYDQIAVLGLDDIDLARSRLETVNKCVKHPSIRQILSILSNPKDCWGDLLT
ncbi:MAG: hypothetical protein PVH84_13215 [Candidatus Aminicenantes bacterium]|jgi:hypothetical protein